MAIHGDAHGAVYYAEEGAVAQRDAAAVKEQLGEHFRATGMEGVAIKYEAAVTEIAALRRQLLAYKLEAAKRRGEGSGGGSSPSAVSPPRLPSSPAGAGSPTRAAELTGTHGRVFRNDEEQQMWNAMNVDVVTKLEAIEKVSRLQADFDEAQREYEQELAVKEEVIAMLTEQMKSMVDRGQHHTLRTENKLLTEQLHSLKREKEMLLLRQNHDEFSAIDREKEMKAEMEARIEAAVHEAHTSTAAQRDALEDELDQLKLLNADLNGALQMAREDLQEARKDLNVARKALAERERERTSVTEIQQQLALNEEMVRDLADSLQAQAISHKAAVSMKSDQDERIRQLTDESAARQDLINRLQDRLLDKEQQVVRTAELLADREKEVLLLQNQLEGFTEHLEGHLQEKENMMRRCTAPLEEELRVRELKLVEAETKAGVMQEMADRKIGELKAQLEGVRQEMRECQDEREAEARDRGSMRDEINRLQAEREEKGTAIQVLASKQVEAAETEIASCRVIIARLEAELQERHRLFDEQQETIAGLQTGVLQAEGDKQQAINERGQYERRLAELQMEIMLRDTKYAETEEANNELRSKSTAALLNLTSQLDDAEQTILKLNDIVNAQEEDVKRHRVENMQQRRDYERRVQDLKQHSETKVKETKANCEVELRQNRAALNKAVQQYEQEVVNAKKMSKELKRADATIKQLKKDVASRAELMAEKNQHAQEELESTRKSISWISSNLEEVSAQLTARDETIGSYRAACERKDMDNEELKALLHKSSEALAILQDASERAHAESHTQIAVLERGICEAEEAKAAADVLRLNAEAQLVETRNCLMRERDELCEKVKGLKEAHAAARRHAEEERGAAEKARAEAEKKLKDAISGLQDRLEDKDVQHRLELSALHEQVARAEEALADLKREGSDQREWNNSLTSRERALDRSQQLNLSVQEELLSRNIQTEAMLTLQHLVLEANHAKLAVRMAECERGHDAEVSQLRESMEAAKQQVRVIDDDAKKLVRARTIELEELQRKMSTRTDETAAAMATARESVAQLTSDIDLLKQQVARKDDEVAHAREELARAQDMLRNVIVAAEEERDASAAQIAMLNSQLTVAEKADGAHARDLADAQAARDTAQEALEEAQAGRAAAVEEAKELRGEVDRKEADVTELCTALEEAMKEVRALRAEQTKALAERPAEQALHDKELALYKSKLQTADEEVCKLRSAVAAARGEASARGVTADETDAERNRMAMQIKSLRVAVDEKDMLLKQQTEELDALRAEREEHVLKAAAATGGLHSLDIERLREVGEARQEQQRAERAAETLRVRLAGTEDLLKRAEQTIAAFETQIADMTRRMHAREHKATADLQALERDHERSVDVLKTDLAAKENAIRSMSGRLETMQRACTAVERGALAEQALAERTHEVRILQMESARKDELLRAMEAATHTSREEALQLRTALADEVARVGRLNDRLAAVKSVGAATGAALDALNGVCDTLAASVHTLDAADPQDNTHARRVVADAQAWHAAYRMWRDGREDVLGGVLSVWGGGSSAVTMSPRRLRAELGGGASPPRSADLLARLPVVAEAAAPAVVVAGTPTPAPTPALSAPSTSARGPAAAVPDALPRHPPANAPPGGLPIVVPSPGVDISGIWAGAAGARGPSSAAAAAAATGGGGGADAVAATAAAAGRKDAHRSGGAKKAPAMSPPTGRKASGSGRSSLVKHAKHAPRGGRSG